MGEKKAKKKQKRIHFTLFICSFQLFDKFSKDKRRGEEGKTGDIYYKLIQHVFSSKFPYQTYRHYLPMAIYQFTNLPLIQYIFPSWPPIWLIPSFTKEAFPSFLHHFQQHFKQHLTEKKLRIRVYFRTQDTFSSTFLSNLPSKNLVLFSPFHQITISPLF